MLSFPEHFSTRHASGLAGKKCGAVQYFYNILPKRIGIIRKSIYLCSIEMRNM
jgi:hypothetical protein